MCYIIVNSSGKYYSGLQERGGDLEPEFYSDIQYARRFNSKKEAQSFIDDVPGMLYCEVDHIITSGKKK